MKKGLVFLFVVLVFFTIQVTAAQTVVRLGDLPKSDLSINVYQVFGFHEGYEGYKLTYIDVNNEPQYLYLPVALRDSYRIYKPQAATGEQNFVIIWKRGETLERVEWFMPRAIDYDLPNFVVKPFKDEDKEIFQRIAESGELILGTEITGAPVIRAPGGGE